MFERRGIAGPGIYGDDLGHTLFFFQKVEVEMSGWAKIDSKEFAMTH